MTVNGLALTDVVGLSINGNTVTEVAAGSRERAIGTTTLLYFTADRAAKCPSRAGSDDLEGVLANSRLISTFQMQGPFSRLGYHRYKSVHNSDFSLPAITNNRKTGGDGETGKICRCSCL